MILTVVSSHPSIHSVDWLYHFYFLKKIAEQDGGKFEAAVYAAQCGNLKRMLPICTDWEVFSPLFMPHDQLLIAFLFKFMFMHV